MLLSLLPVFLVIVEAAAGSTVGVAARAARVARAAAPPLPPPPTISCNNGALCGVHADCLQHAPPASEKSSLFFGKPLSGPNCKSGIWIRPISDTVWIVKMQVKTIGTTGKEIQLIDPIKGMQANHKDKVLFGCDFQAGDVIPIGGEGFHVEMYNFEKSRLDYQDCYCSLRIENADKIALLDHADTYMEYIITERVSDKGDTNEFDKVPAMRKCDITKASTDLDVELKNFIKQPIKNLLTDELSCTVSYPHGKLYAGRADQEAKEVNKVECVTKNVNGVNNWVYKITPKTGTPIEIAKDTRFEAFCAMPVALMCKDPHYRTETPPKFTKDKSDPPKVTFECKDDAWLINNYFRHTGKVTCKNSQREANRAGWFVTHEQKEIELTMAECPNQKPVPLPLLTIDWSRCGKEAVCAVAETCVGGRGTKLLFGVSNLQADNCTTGIWIRPISEKEWIVKMQVKSIGNNQRRIEPILGMKLNHSGAVQFGCNLNDEKQVVPIAGDGLDIEMFAFEKSRLEREDCFCSLHIKNADKIASLAKGLTFMEYVLTTGIFDSAVAESRRCDIHKANTNLEEILPGFIKGKFTNLLAMDLKCVASPRTNLYAGIPGEKAVEADTVICKKYKIGNKWEWKYEIKFKSGEKHEVANDAEFEAFCAMPVETRCTDPDSHPDQNNRAKLPKFHEDPNTKIVTLECENNRWLINNKLYYTGTATCKNSLVKPNSASWFVTSEGKDVELAQAECTSDMKCANATSYTNECRSKSSCESLWKLDGIRCPVEHRLRVNQRSSGKPLDMEIEKFKCDQKIGRFVVEDNKTVVIDKGANIYCEADSKKVEALNAGAFNAVSMAFIVVVALVTVAVVIRIVVVVS